MELPPVTLDPCAICGTLRRTLVYRNGKFVCGQCAKGTESAGQFFDAQERAETEDRKQAAFERDPWSEFAKKVDRSR